MRDWLLLLVSVPPHPSSLRVKVWRKLQALGAVALKSSVYMLPFTPEHYERFQWLAQEIQKDGGEATFLRVDRIENMKPADAVRLFHAARNRDYQELAQRYRKTLQGLSRKPLTGAARDRLHALLGRLGRDLQRIRDIDFFEAPGYRDVARLKETIEMRLQPLVAAAPAAGPLVPAGSLRGRRWVTRPRPHIDRVASAWLIKRFIDPEAEFLFAVPEEFPPDAVAFDAPGAEFSHHGEDCTFETLLQRSGLRDPRLTRLAEIVHEVDLRDGKFDREEARGVDLAIRGLVAALKDDHEVLAHGMVLFDGLYAMVGERR